MSNPRISLAPVLLCLAAAVLGLQGCAQARGPARTPQSVSAALTESMDPHFPGAPYYWHTVEAALADAVRPGDRSAMVVGWARMHWIDAGLYVLSDTGTAIQCREWQGWDDNLEYDPGGWTIHETTSPASRRCYQDLYALLQSVPVGGDHASRDGWPRVEWLWLPGEGKLWRFNEPISVPAMYLPEDPDSREDAIRWLQTEARRNLDGDWGAGAPLVALVDALADSIGIDEGWWEDFEAE